MGRWRCLQPVITCSRWRHHSLGTGAPQQPVPVKAFLISDWGESIAQASSMVNGAALVTAVPNLAVKRVQRIQV